MIPPPPGGAPGPNVQNTPIVQSCAQPNVGVSVLVAATPPPTEYGGEVTETTIVLIDVTVDADGSIVSTRVNKSSGNDKLDQAAIAAARASRYSPRIEECNPVRSTYLLKLKFSPPASPVPSPTSKIATHR